jgi:hypothetical protein
VKLFVQSGELRLRGGARVLRHRRERRPRQRPAAEVPI